MSEIRKKLIRNLLIITGIFVLVAVILLIVQGCGKTKKSYTNAEKKLVSAAEEYFEKQDLLPKKEGETAKVSSDVLVSNNYIKKLDELVDDNNCSGYVIVQKNNEKYNYMPYLVCSKYQTNIFFRDIASKVVTEDDGVYSVNNEYVYRGENVNNYMSFAGRTWRIIKITEDGYLKLISENKEENDYIWDNRYNIDTDSYDGINNYEKSRLRDEMHKIYDNKEIISDSAKQHIVARPICVGKRKYYDLSLSVTTECDSKLEGEYIDLISPTDIPNASIDKNCTGIRSESCTNYNYFNGFFEESWSIIGVEGTTSEMYYTTGGSMSTSIGDYDRSVQLIVYVNANEKIRSGDGSKKSPYKM